MSKVIEITEDNFQTEVKDSKVPVMLDFSAEWCGPCKMIDPFLKEASETYDGKLKVGKVDVDKNQTIAANYSIMSIPAVIFFKEGKEIDRVVGALPKKNLFERIDKVLSI